MELVSVDSKYQSFFRRLFVDNKTFLYFALLITIAYIIGWANLNMLACSYLFLLLILISSVHRNIKTLYRIEIDKKEVIITFFHYSSLKQIICLREQFKLDKQLNLGEDGKLNELQLFIGDILYFTQQTSGIWTNEKIVAVETINPGE